MIQIRKSLTAFYFFAGIAVGFFLGSSIDKRWSNVVAKFIASSTIILLAFFWRRIESLAHDHYLETWSLRRTRGAWRFVLYNYVFLRGIILFFAVAGPMLPSLILTTETVLILFASLILLALLLAYLGLEAWTECEQDYQVQLLRLAAEQSRTATN